MFCGNRKSGKSNIYFIDFEFFRFPSKNISLINLRNRTIAYIFATELLLIFNLKMRRDIFQAIADPTRRAILSLIALHAMTPNAIAEHFDSSRQAVSKHIKILAECQLLEQREMGREIYYHFNPKKMKEIDKWLEQFRRMWESRYEKLDNVLNQIKSKSK
jgi:DNA-binding transcriptional ArsR family regulator